MRYLNAALPKRIDCTASTYTRVLARTRACRAGGNVPCPRSVHAASRWIRRKLKNTINLAVSSEKKSLLKSNSLKTIETIKKDIKYCF